VPRVGVPSTVEHLPNIRFLPPPFALLFWITCYCPTAFRFWARGTGVARSAACRRYSGGAYVCCIIPCWVVAKQDSSLSLPLVPPADLHAVLLLPQHALALHILLVPATFLQFAAFGTVACGLVSCLPFGRRAFLSSANYSAITRSTMFLTGGRAVLIYASVCFLSFSTLSNAFSPLWFDGRRVLYNTVREHTHETLRAGVLSTLPAYRLGSCWWSAFLALKPVLNSYRQTVSFLHHERIPVSRSSTPWTFSASPSSFYPAFADMRARCGACWRWLRRERMVDAVCNYILPSYCAAPLAHPSPPFLPGTADAYSTF